MNETRPLPEDTHRLEWDIDNYNDDANGNCYNRGMNEMQREQTGNEWLLVEIRNVFTEEVTFQSFQEGVEIWAEK